MFFYGVYIMFDKKAEGSLELILIILFVSGVFLFFAIVLVKNADAGIDENKILVQLIEDKLFSSKCFSQQYDTIEKEKFTEENLNSCFGNEKKDVLFRVNIKNDDDKLLSEYLYINNAKNIFEEKKKNCNLNSNVFCNKLVYPVSYVDENGIRESVFLILETIT